MSELDNNNLLALKEQIAKENRLPSGFASRLRGTTPEEITADAIELKKTLGINTAPPLAGYDPPHAYDNIKEVQLHNAYRDTLKQLHVMDD